MNEGDRFDGLLAARFEQENRHLPADAFVASTMQRVRALRRRAQVLHAGWRVAALMAGVAASPWLIPGVARLNAALDSSLTSTMALPVAWTLGALAILVMAVARARRR